MLNINRDYLMKLDLGALKKQRTMMYVIAVLLLLGGLFCLANPFISGAVVSTIIGILFVMSGIALIYGIFINRKHNLWPVLTSIFLGIAYILVGYIFMKNPAMGILSLAFILSVLFLAGGIIRLVTGFKMLSMPRGWIQVLIGVLDLVIFYLLVSSGPEMSIVFVLTLIGIEMLFSSFSCFMVAGLLKRR